MRYHAEPPRYEGGMYGEVYICDHPVYSRCTLFRIGNRGLAVIQQQFDQVQKRTYWREIEPWLADRIYLHPGFLDYFEKFAGVEKSGIFPTVSVRKIMWALRMKPLKKERWETVFDRKFV